MHRDLKHIAICEYGLLFGCVWSQTAIKLLRTFHVELLGVAVCELAMPGIPRYCFRDDCLPACFPWLCNLEFMPALPPPETGAAG